MSNEISNTKFYMFLSSFQQNGTSWDEVVDNDYGNGDGTVVKWEFNNFIKKEWTAWNGNEGGAPSNDLINEFWKKLDTNTKKTNTFNSLNAIDKGELVDIEKQLQVYLKVNDFIANNVKIPNVLSSTGSKWKSMVTGELTKLADELIKSGKADDLESELGKALPAIANKATAQCCAIEYQDSLKGTVLANYPEYKIADDKTLESIINAYLNGVDPNATPETIKSDIQGIVDAYFATAGLKDAPKGVDLTKYGYDPKPINDIQVEVIKKNIKDALSTLMSEYEGYEKEFDAAVRAFIEKQLQSGKTFDELKNSASEFENSEFKTNLDTMIEARKTLGEISDTNSDFYKALVEKFGPEIADLISKNADFIDKYQEIITDALNKLANGELTSDKLKDYIISQIQANLNAILKGAGLDMANMDLTALAKLYNTRANSADDVIKNDKEAGLAEHRQAAIDYCDAIASKGAEYKNAVIEIVGNNWADKINSMTLPNEIKNLVNKLITKVADVQAQIKKEEDKANIANDITSETKMNEIKEFISSNYETVSSDLAFYVNDSGEIVFVDYKAAGSVFDDIKDSDLQSKFNNLKTQFETTYSDVLSALGLSATEKSNLYNIALYITLSDPAVVRSMYEEQKLDAVMEDVAKNYVKLLEKLSNDENTRNYVKNYPTGSILAGCTTYGNEYETRNKKTNTDLARNLNKYYHDDATQASDDWVSIKSRGNTTYSNGTYSGSIIILTGCSGDADPVNNAMKSMLSDYITSYSKFINGNRIIELFKKAQEKAFNNLDFTITDYKPDGSSIYAYGECDGGKKDNADTVKGSGQYYSANVVLINVAYEMEKLIAREMAGLN